MEPLKAEILTCGRISSGCGARLLNIRIGSLPLARAFAASVRPVAVLRSAIQPVVPMGRSEISERRKARNASSSSSRGRERQWRMRHNSRASVLGWPGCHSLRGDGRLSLISVVAQGSRRASRARDFATYRTPHVQMCFVPHQRTEAALLQMPRPRFLALINAIIRRCASANVQGGLSSTDGDAMICAW
jgi:hypothetical protein